MKVSSKLHDFQNNREAQSRYRKAVQILRDLGIDQILMELSLPEQIALANPNAGNAAIGALYESLGYQKCLAQLFNLDELAAGAIAPLVADFGASEKLGISLEEAKSYAGRM